MKKIILTSAILLSVSICCFSQNKNDELHDKCMFDDEYCKSLAIKGNAIAQNAYGLKFEMAENYTEALKWYNKSALQGNASACNNIGTCYFYGYGVEENYLFASKWYKKAIEKGYDNTTVYQRLAYCYYYKGKNQNLQESFTWFRKAADQKDSESQYMIGVMYENGLGIIKDLTMAFNSYKEAAKNYIPAMYDLALFYYMGTGVEKNYIEAVKWFRECASYERSKETAANAQFALGICYLNGQGVEKNLIEAEKWIDLAAKNGQLKAIEYNKNKAH